MTTIQDGDKWLRERADEMKREAAQGVAPQPVQLSVSELLAKWSYQRRSDWISNRIRKILETLGLRTDPDFTEALLDSSIEIKLDTDAAFWAQYATDPTLRVGQLDFRRGKLDRVSPDAPLEKATTIMTMEGYSRLPVMMTDYNVVGMVTWESIGKCLNNCERVQECMEQPVRKCMEQPVEEVSVDTRLFEAVEKASKRGYVLVRGDKEKDNNRFIGILTATDLVNEFEKRARPFLLIGEIEGHLRNLIHGKFTSKELEDASDNKAVDKPADLTLGDYCTLLGEKDNWKSLGLGINRKEFTARLNDLRDIRNGVMHFNPGGIDGRQRETIIRLARFFDDLLKRRKKKTA